MTQGDDVEIIITSDPGREDEPRKEEDREGASDYIINHIKTFVTIFMIFGTIAVIVLIVMIHKWRFEANLEVQERVWMFKDGATDIKYSVHLPGNPHSPFCNWPSIYDSPDNHMERHDEYIGVV